MSKTVPTWASVVVTGLGGFALGLLVAALLVAGNTPHSSGSSNPATFTSPPAQPVTMTVTGSPPPPVTVTTQLPPDPPSTTTATVLVTPPPAPVSGPPTSSGPSSAFPPGAVSVRW
ncbi:hypothetical protein [Amycolatopsis sp. PS_44_ISF1]|uniref:hypothetical protein n=1 Tax=Amycolatopsis sp. PS_44_ISF1 TaxID=2974917 RepID=UPI0028DFFF52|nr:hypothetical protein [Amycolatopsis sp. PS_44_ISF1]MDT8910195.1 hypothetical protein [Amycolatopsis sp. PS_44_ISF1]MDT8916382.1 hypothetical protein [Amycolatopsis sp. PS_44_ISF1]MDT8916392.1 hypothetical protein [Amycolatopsis sp. PS_44_ISF1]